MKLFVHDREYKDPKAQITEAKMAEIFFGRDGLIYDDILRTNDMPDFVTPIFMSTKTNYIVVNPEDMKHYISPNLRYAIIDDEIYELPYEPKALEDCDHLYFPSGEENQINDCPYYLYIVINSEGKAEYLISYEKFFIQENTTMKYKLIGGFHYVGNNTDGRHFVRNTNSNQHSEIISDTRIPVDPDKTVFGPGWDTNTTADCKIVPNSVWTLCHRPTCDPSGMVEITNGLWADIHPSKLTIPEKTCIQYLMPVSETKESIKYGTDSWYMIVRELGKVGKRLPTYAEYAAIAYGTPDDYTRQILASNGNMQDGYAVNVLNSNGQGNVNRIPSMSAYNVTQIGSSSNGWMTVATSNLTHRSLNETYKWVTTMASGNVNARTTNRGLMDTASDVNGYSYCCENFSLRSDDSRESFYCLTGGNVLREDLTAGTNTDEAKTESRVGPRSINYKNSLANENFLVYYGVCEGVI